MDRKNGLQQKRTIVDTFFVFLIVVALFAPFGFVAPVALGQTSQTETSAPPIQLQIPIPGTNGRFVTEVKDFGEYFLAFYVFFVGIVGILATVMVMYGGYRWIAAAGNASHIQGAKETMSGAIIGLVLALTSFLLLNLINPQLVRVRVPHLEVIKGITQRLAGPYCASNEAVSLDGRPLRAGEKRVCGTTYTLIPGGGTCQGAGCPIGSDATDPSQYCYKKKSGAVEIFRCARLPQACMESKNCDDLDRRLPFGVGARNYGCGQVIPNGSYDGCIYGELLTCAASTEERVDCNYRFAGQDTECWDNARPRLGRAITPFGDFDVACASVAEETRPVFGADGICCGRIEKSEINCQERRPGKDVEVDCARFNAIPGRYENNVESPCATKCWMELKFTKRPQ